MLPSNVFSVTLKIQQQQNQQQNDKKKLIIK